MLITLTQPLHGFSQVKLTNLRVDLERKILLMTFSLGDTVDETFVRGPVIAEEKLVRNVEQVLDGGGQEVTPADPQYDDLVGDDVFTAQNLYDYAIAQGWYAGVVG